MPCRSDLLDGIEGGFDSDELTYRHTRDRLDADTDAWSYEQLDPDVFGGQLGYEQVELIAAVWLHAVKRG